MQRIVIGAAILNQMPLDWAGNRRRIQMALREARARGVSVLCLPELCLTGYGCEDAFHAPDTVTRAERLLAELLPETAGLVVAFGMPVLHHKALFDASALAVDGKLVGVVAKRFLAGDGIHYEPRWFKPWQEGVRVNAHLAGYAVPMGDLLIDVGGIRIGFEICEDAWVAGRPGAALAVAGVDLILNPSASHFAFGKIDVRRRFVTEGSRAFNVAYAYANLVGNESGRAIYDGGALIAAGGRILAMGPRLGCQEAHVTSAVVDVEAGRYAAARASSFRPRLDDPPGGMVSVPFAWPDAHITAPANSEAPWESSPCRKEEEFTRALALALFDYLRKSRSRGYVVSLSGGADSTAVATLVALMVRLAWTELGEVGFRGRLAHIPALEGAADPAAAIRCLLTTVWQGTANSSATTRDAARRVAQALGSDHLELDVEPFVHGYVDAVGAAVGRQPSWEADDIALQNIQARARAPGVWMIANLRDALLLATSNRSEAAVGYTTMDGDTCGGLSPIAGIDKAFLRSWLEWMQAQGPLGLGPIPSLEVVTSQRSTPELRPSAASQRSEEDLMPFPVLDAIERLAIRDKLGPVQVFTLLRERGGHPPERLRAWVERFFRLWCRNQWKRERFAPSFHLDDENLDPKTWCRFPILSGGFEEELSDLRSLPL
jgi:NAD+ synthase (glutamine-hydrolysing)